MNIKRDRNSSLELLRIICMFLIIAHHYVAHGNFSFSLNNNIYATAYLKVFSMFGKSACSIFAIMTGYFMISSDINKKFFNKLVPILFRMLFCSLTVLAIVKIFGGEFGTNDIKSVLLPLFYGNNWYVNTYVWFFFLIPFVNEYLLSISKKRFQQLIIAILCIYFIPNTIIFSNFDVFHYFTFMLFMYVFGAYYKLYGNKNYDNKRSIIISLTCFLIMIASSILIVLLAYKFKNEELLLKSNPLESYENVISLAFSYNLFTYFANKNFKSNVINSVASTTLSIYMLHDNSLIYQLLWLRWFPNAEYINSPYLHSVIKVTCIFIVCMLIDFLRQATVNKIFNKTIYTKINTLIEKIKNKINLYNFFETK